MLFGSSNPAIKVKPRRPIPDTLSQLKTLNTVCGLTVYGPISLIR